MSRTLWMGASVTVVALATALSAPSFSGAPRTTGDVLTHADGGANVAPPPGPDLAQGSAADAAPQGAPTNALTLGLPPPTTADPKVDTAAPTSVHCAVILIAHAEAEGAPANARTKEDARAQARRVAELARTDWNAAARNGDSGTADDIGSMPRGVLDPEAEAALFALATGATSEPISTPRGYWIAKRIE